MKKSLLAAAATAVVATLALAGCAGENAAPNTGDDGAWSASTLDIDYATYNPLSLIIKDQGWLEEAVGGDVAVNWVFSAGSNRANEGLRNGVLDVGSTAGSAALLARSNGSPIQVIDIYSQPNWAAILVPAGSDITAVEDLRGKRIAATQGTDPYFFLLQSLEAHGVGIDEVTIENLQHADGKAALESGAVDAWSGLDPLLSTSVEVAGSVIIYDNIDLNSYGFLNATEEFLERSPDLAQLVVNAYEKARAWAIANPDETAAILAEEAAIDLSIASAVLIDRTVIDLDPVPGEVQRAVLAIIGPIFVESGDVPNQGLIDDALANLFEPRFAEAADPDAL